ncbi:MAG: SUMF1/EgtB/PvdO family nonheme iron enzyme [Thermogutta sp.]
MTRRGFVLVLLLAMVLVFATFTSAQDLAMLLPKGEGTPGEETKAVLTWLQAMRRFQVVYLDGPERFLDDQGHSVALSQFNVIWYHQGDYVNLPADLQNPGTLEGLRSFVAEGKGLFLSGVAAHLVVDLGLETAPMRTVKPGQDRYRAALIPVVKDHPIFVNLPLSVADEVFFTSGGYPAFADFYRSGGPTTGRLLARAKSADENPLVEYCLGKGRIIVLGWRIPHFSLTNNEYRQSLERLICNILDYLADEARWVDWKESPNATVPVPASELPSEKEILALESAIEDLVMSFGERYSGWQGFQSKLEELKAACDEARKDSPVESDVAQRLRSSFVNLQRETLLANPLLDFDELLYVERREPELGLPANWESNSSLPKTGYDNRLCVISLRGKTESPYVLFEPSGQRYVGEVDLHFDADRLLVSMPGSFDRFQVFELGLKRKDQRWQVATVRELPLIREPDVDNYDACYLPDGRIAFTSTAPFTGVPCVYGKSHITNMYRWDPDGTIRQLTVDQEHNWHPSLLNNGRILYLRWEYTDLPHAHSRILFSMNPDGTNQMAYYGSNSYFPNSFFYARAVPNHPTKVVGIASGHHGTRRSGRLLLIDPAVGRHEAQGVVQEIPPGDSKVEPLIRDELVDGVWPQFLTPWPLSEKYFLVSCKPAPNRPWGLYLADVFGNLTLIQEKPGFALLEPIPLAPRPRPPVIPDRIDPSQKDAIVYLVDIYRGPGLKGIPRGTVKKLRLISYEFSFRDMGGLLGSIGMDGPWDVKRILGTVPVEDDGSAFFRVPAYTPVAVQPLDEEGRALQIMRSWFTAMPGEVLSCIGCHEHANEVVPNIQTYAGVKPPRSIEPWYGPPRGFSFSREVQPVLDRYCVSCHNGQANEPFAFDLRGDVPLEGWSSAIAGHVSEKVGGKFSIAYANLHRHIRRPGIESDMHLLSPMEYHAATTELVQILKKGHYGVQLSAEAWDRLYTWIDLNAPYHGRWSEIVGPETVAPLLARAREMRKRFTGMDDNWEEIPAITVFAGDAPVSPERPEDSEGVELVGYHSPDRPGENHQSDSPNMTLAQSADWPFSAEEARRRQEKLGDWRRVIELAPGVTLTMVRIPPGQFIMGSEKGNLDEQPRRVAVIPHDFWMGACEITNRQFAVFDPTHDSHVESLHGYQFGVHGFPLNEPEQPVVRISWYQAREFCNWLTERTGVHFRLPTETEWEYACRAGTETPFWFGTLEEDFSQYANLADAKLSEFVMDTYIRVRTIPNPNPFDDWIPKDPRWNDGGLTSMPVGSYRPNPWGLYDMHGNVWEWTLSPYPNHSSAQADGDNEAKSSELRVVRGGSWYDRPKRATSSYRLGYAPYSRVFNVGFRIVAEDLPNRD